MSSPLAELYRQERARQSASMIYQQPAAPQQRPQIYVENQYEGLGVYTSARKSKWEQGGRGPESDQAYVARLRGHLQHLSDALPADELERVAADYNSAVQRLEGGVQNHAQLREHLAQTQDDHGITGTLSPHERAVAIGNRGHGGQQQLQALGHLAAQTTVGAQPRATSADVGVILARQAAEQQAVMQQHTAAIRGASGEGIFVR